MPLPPLPDDPFDRPLFREAGARRAGGGRNRRDRGATPRGGPDAPAPRVVVVNRRPGGVAMIVVRALAVLLLVAGLGAGAAGFGVYVHFARDLPRLDTFDEMSRSGVTRFEAADGRVVGEWYQERRLAVTWGELPERLVLAFLAAEDARFFEHSGIDIRGVIRAMITNLRTGSLREGASTITQQLAKTLVGSDKSYARKVREAILARRMEDIYSKTQILTWYLNVIYLGHGSYGVQAAAQNYFRKNVWELSLAEMAMVAGLAQSPSRVNPVVNPPAALKRMAHVLGNMRARGWISADEERAALEEALVTHPLRDALGDHVPHYTETARQRVIARYDDGAGGWLDRGLTVSMAVDPAAQRVAERAVRDGLEDLARRQGFPGPLGRLERDDFFARNAPWSAPAAKDRVLARVAAVDKGSARVEISPSLAGTLKLPDMRWAAPYTEFDRDARGRRVVRGRMSFKGKLTDVRKALAVGDVVLVEVGAPAKAQKSKKRQKTKKEEPARDPATADEVALTLVPVPLMEGALLSYGLETGGGVDALVGGWDFDRSQVNRAWALRQTGSTMKPIVYSKAYDLGLPPSALFSGAPFREGEYNPTGARSKDDMLVFDALVKSENSVSLRVLQYVLNHTSLEDYREWGRRLGLARELTGFTSEVLGADQTLFSMAHAFGAFARRGLAPDMHLIRKVTDRDGRVLERNHGPLDPAADLGESLITLWRDAVSPPERLIPETTAWLVANNLATAVTTGTGKRARGLDRPAAGKTGTLAYDVWFDGFTAERVAAVWIGADRRERTLGPSERDNKVYGSDTAAPVWLAFMQEVDVGRAKRPVAGPRPDDVIDVRVDPETGLLATRGGREIPHRAGTEPTERSFEETDPSNIGALETEF